MLLVRNDVYTFGCLGYIFNVIFALLHQVLTETISLVYQEKSRDVKIHKLPILRHFSGNSEPTD